MNIKEIEESIKILEDSDTTVDNVIELSSLYIVKQNLKNDKMTMVNDVQKEINDILPCYNKYVDTKIRYNKGELNENEVINTLKLLCVEIQEFLSVLYCGTNMRKERKIIENMILQCYEKLYKE